VATAASVVAGWGPERRPQADEEGGCSRREAGEPARWGADGEVGPAVAQEGLAVHREPWIGEGSGEERDVTHGWPGERGGASHG
jgi:hypothetical protein